MNTTDLADKLAATHGLTKVDARASIEAFLAAIVEAVAAGEEVALGGFGKFKIKETPARDGRNPATGETIAIAAGKKLTFTTAKAVKDRLNG